MTKMSTKSTKLLLMLACAATVHASGKVAISTMPVIQQDAPAQILSVQKTLENQVAGIVLKNTSDRPISSVQIGWAVDVPAGCASVPVGTQVDRRTSPVAIAPNATATLKDLGPYTNDVVEKAHSENASLISVEVAVIGVDFADGTRWTSSLPLDQTFDKAQVDYLSHRCSNGKLVANATAGTCTAAPALTASSTPAVSSSSENLNPVPQDTCYFICVGTPQHVYCANGVQHCNITICSNPSACPNQQCYLECN
jgi:hypothetical protein